MPVIRKNRATWLWPLLAVLALAPAAAAKTDTKADTKSASKSASKAGPKSATKHDSKIETKSSKKHDSKAECYRETLLSSITQLLPYVGYPRTLNAIRCVDEVVLEQKP